VERYLDDAGGRVEEVRALVQEDQRLQELLTTPLFLRMIVRTYGGEAGARPGCSAPWPSGAGACWPTT